MRKKIQHIIVVITLSSSATYAQVGIGNANPHGGAILDLNNQQQKGLALPDLSAPVADTLGLVYFDVEDSVVKYFEGSKGYNGLSPWKYKYNGSTSSDTYYQQGGNVGIGVTDPKVKLSIDGGTEAESSGNNGFVLIGDAAGYHLVLDDDEIMVKSDPSNMDTLKLQEGGGTVQIGESPSTPSALNVYGAVQQNGFDLVPSGSVIMWYGNLSGVNPIIGGVANTNWRLCDGDGGTPDLRDKFVVGAGSTYNGNPTTNSTGGDISSAHTHFVDPIPYITPLGQGTHAHSGTTSGPSGTYDPAVSLTTRDVASDNHTHTFSTAATQGAHQHTINLPPRESTGASNTDNLPPYFSLFFIMKL
ncbi:hypothetical protein N9M27_00660 [Flavobacteriales bacterium]|nr:hypothetical protein [Flavobacteriales bacterium]